MRILKHKGASVIAGLSISLLTFSSVDALNIGEARSQSYLGQPLSIFVPVSDSADVDLNQLIVSKPSSTQLGELNISQKNSNLVYQVVTNGSEKGILITTIQPFNEPFVDVGVKLDYKGVSQLRKLTALIDLQPLAEGSTVGNPLPITSQNNSFEIAGSQISSVDIARQSTYSSEIMGPYDWAKAGAIPKKFGPVLEGQSLWRVARRINESMNVSIDQMMWALFQANPQAFSSDNVSSLQAGSVLTIPTESVVREVTEMGAVRLLTAQSQEIDSSVVSSVENTISDETTIESTPAELSFNDIAEKESSEVSETIEPSNPVGLIDSEANNNDAAEKTANVVSLSELSEVDELKNEISYLNQQLIEKDEQIKVLEERLAIAETSNNTVVANESAVGAPLEDSTTIVQSETIDTAPVSTSPLVSNEVSDVTVLSDTAQADNNAGIVEQVESAQIETQQAELDVVSSSDQNTGAEKSSLLALTLGGLTILLLGSAFIFRKSFIPAMLKLFGDRYEYDETAPLFSSISEKRKPLRDLEQLRKGANNGHALENNSANYDSDLIPSNKSAQDDFEDFEDYSFFVDDEELMDVEELSFPDRIKQLIDSGDYDEAKKTVSFATAANVDEHEINISMLKIFAAESDQESFEKLFDKVHANIDEYDAESQLIIAELQSEMAIGKVINFGTDQMAG